MSKPKVKELMPLYSMIMRGMEVGDVFTPFPVKFRVLKTPSDHLVLLRELGEGVVKYTNEKELARTICKYSQSVNRDEFLLDFDESMKVAKYWMADPGEENFLTKEPAAVLEKSQEGLCFHRLPFDADYTPNKCPLFDEFMSRCGNMAAFAAFIGSMFFPEADRQQYVWLFGEGRNGKGSLARLLRYFMGPSYLSEDANQANGRFWTSGLLGKRCVVFPDTNNVAFVQSGLFKSITGGDAVRVERKNQDSLSAELSCKVILMSNDRPNVSSQVADRRRIIYVPVEPIEGDPDPEYERRLLEEAPHILGAVKDVYLKTCPKHGSIPVNEELTKELVDDYNEEFDIFFKEFFTLDQSGYAVASRVWEICRIGGYDNNKIGRFRKFLEWKYGIKRVQTTDGARVYKGMRVAPTRTLQ